MTQVDIWQKVEAELMAAYALLPETTIESDNGYRKVDFFAYIAANELLLAMEELDGVTEDNPIPSKQFWNHLIQAANMMGHGHAERYKSIQSAAT
ncbi:TPA: hypothetical protein NKZ51_003909 [Vibrio parahaemolyticus]|uniref:hypothetical protein n=1 Tax=Vibrio parahaemolyticus TaxID=670 RepID=UPI0011232661|nr:hypothetical protein [Vibrio parahaemolyticus]EGQ7920134.1 hypothetical protein [Vibrio parahaemolyticus]EGQ9944836.1 hypothetical protein [Vibrio parahaemolyticus]EHH3648739.1 hypothetical protein [Vibrio parahaemolyticus]EHH3737287.1 hypothetical protein [Vibrio parahaemolyticus]EHJ9995335.1 hypothetical protein [Vibrio parahaemolyticus]